jgi:hypothetical protein
MIDIHAHTSNHVLNGLHTKYATISDLETLAFKHNIEKIYLMATYFPLKKTGVGTTDLLSRIKNHTTFGCFGSLNMETMQEFKELEIYADAGLIDGIKLYPGYQNIILSHPSLHCIYYLAQLYNLPIAIHMGELHSCCCNKNATQLKCKKDSCPLDKRQHLSHPNQLKEIATMFPNVRFLAAHLANPFFTELQNVMRQCPNVYTDISGLLVSGTNQDTTQYIQLLKAELMNFISIDSHRILFGSDFPIQSYEDSINLLNSIDITPTTKQRILTDNSKSLLKGIL